MRRICMSNKKDVNRSDIPLSDENRKGVDDMIDSIRASRSETESSNRESISQAHNRVVDGNQEVDTVQHN